jgi:hypothetical protein
MSSDYFMCGACVCECVRQVDGMMMIMMRVCNWIENIQLRRDFVRIVLKIFVEKSKKISSKSRVRFSNFQLSSEFTFFFNIIFGPFFLFSYILLKIKSNPHLQSKPIKNNPRPMP